MIFIHQRKQEKNITLHNTFNFTNINLILEHVVREYSMLFFYNKYKNYVIFYMDNSNNEPIKLDGIFFNTIKTNVDYAGEQKNNSSNTEN